MKIKETCFQWKKLVTCCSQWVSTLQVFCLQIKRMMKKDEEHEECGGHTSLRLGLKKSLSRTFSRISLFKDNQEKRFDLKTSLQKKLTTLLSYIKIL